jgi:hypothetical protein
METMPLRKSTGREIVERVAEAALGSVPLVGNALAVSFVTALGWRLEERRERWFTELAESLEDHCSAFLHDQPAGPPGPAGQAVSRAY